MTTCPNLEKCLVGLLDDNFMTAVSGLKTLMSDQGFKGYEHISPVHLPRLAYILQHPPCPQTLYETLWIVTLLAKSPVAHQIPSSDLLPALLNILHDLPLQPQAEELSEFPILKATVNALGNLAGDSPGARSILLKTSVLSGLLALIEPDHQELELILWAILNLFRDASDTDINLLLPAIPVLVDYIHMKSAAWAISYFSIDKTNTHERLVYLHRSKYLTQTAELLETKLSTDVLYPLLQALGRVIHWKQEGFPCAVHTRIISSLCTILETFQNTQIQHSILIVLKNYLKYFPIEVKSIILAQLLPTLVSGLTVNEEDVLISERLRLLEMIHRHYQLQTGVFDIFKSTPRLNLFLLHANPSISDFTKQFATDLTVKKSTVMFYVCFGDYIQQVFPSFHHAESYLKSWSGRKRLKITSSSFFVVAFDLFRSDTNAQAVIVRGKSGHGQEIFEILKLNQKLKPRK